MIETTSSRTGADALVRSVWWTLRVVFGVVPIVAGLDKFFDILVDWDKYLSPAFQRLVPMSPSTFMYVVGVIEIVVGLGMLLTPWTRIFGWIVALWLWGIAVNLIAGGFYDIAVRDVVMGISSVCLARLSAIVPVHAERRVPGFVERAEARA